MQGVAGTLRPREVRGILYRSRDIGYGVEEGSIEGFWTGEVDTWGKLTIRDANGGPTLYLFPDEVVAVGFEDEQGSATVYLAGILALVVVPALVFVVRVFETIGGALS